MTASDVQAAIDELVNTEIHSLDELTDVVITLPNLDGYILSYDIGTTRWINIARDYLTSTEITALNHLTDITGENIEDLSNVVITSPVNDQYLKYSSGNWINSTATPSSYWSPVGGGLYLRAIGYNGVWIADDNN